MLKRTTSCSKKEIDGLSFVFTPLSVRVLLGAFFILLIGLSAATLLCFIECFSKRIKVYTI